MEQKQQTREFFTIEEVAQILNVNYNTVWKLVRKGAFPAVRVGRTYRIPAIFVNDLREVHTK